MAQAVLDQKPATATRTLVDFLEEKAREFGDKDALLFKPSIRYQRWSYEQIWEWSGKIASLLQQRGLEKGDRAIIWAYNCPQWALAFFGCMRAGVIAVPIDLRSTRDFVQNVSVKTRPKIMFVSRATPDGWQQLGAPEVFIEDMEELCKELPQSNDVSIKPDDLVEIMFTSGTTGDPKGVMLTHGNLLSNIEGISKIVPGKPTDRMLSILPLSHVFEQMAGLLVALNAGLDITYPTSRQPSIIFRLMKERGATQLLVVPQVLDLFMKGIEREVTRQGREGIWNLSLKIARYLPFRLRRLLFRRVHKQFGGGLELFFLGGAALDPLLGDKWARLGIRVIQGYGATETSAVVSGHSVRNPHFDSAGPPLPGVEVRIADDGEILVHGDNVSPGYWNAPEQTASAFVDGWYRTGDQGEIDKNGFLHVKGRKKDMIVLSSGQNVYPDDIEVVLNKHEAVNEAVVVGLSRSPDVEVHAVLRMDDPSLASQAVSWTNTQLAEHQRIRGFTVWPDDDLPRTHTLKVKKNIVIDRLQRIETNVSEQPSNSAARSADEPRGVLHLVVEISGVPSEQITPAYNLSDDLNLDSLRRVELLSAIEAELGVYIDESRIAADTTVQNLIDIVDAGRNDTDTKKFPRWGMSLWSRILRGAIHRLIMFPLLRIAYKLDVTGLDNLRDIKGQVMFAPNHNLHSDNPLIIKAMPSKIRRRLAIAAWDENWNHLIWSVLYPLLGNGFPISKGGAVRHSLENLGRIVDEGWSVMIYPEGELTIGGPMKPFLSGIGLIAVEGRLPVVPIYVNPRKMGFPWRYPFIKRGHVEIRFGKPITFDQGTPYDDAAKTVEAAVRAL